MRKTIDIKRVWHLANAFLANSRDEQTAERLGVASLLEAVLMETGTYKGYRYLRANWEDDHTRRVYFLHPKLEDKK